MADYAGMGGGIQSITINFGSPQGSGSVGGVSRPTGDWGILGDQDSGDLQNLQDSMGGPGDMLKPKLVELLQMLLSMLTGGQGASQSQNGYGQSTAGAGQAGTDLGFDPSSMGLDPSSLGMGGGDGSTTAVAADGGGSATGSSTDPNDYAAELGLEGIDLSGAPGATGSGSVSGSGMDGIDPSSALGMSGTDGMDPNMGTDDSGDFGMGDLNGSGMSLLQKIMKLLEALVGQTQPDGGCDDPPPDSNFWDQPQNVAPPPATPWNAAQTAGGGECATQGVDGVSGTNGATQAGTASDVGGAAPPQAPDGTNTFMSVPDDANQIVAEGMGVPAASDAAGREQQIRDVCKKFGMSPAETEFTVRMAKVESGSDLNPQVHGDTDHPDETKTYGPISVAPNQFDNGDYKRITGQDPPANFKECLFNSAANYPAAVALGILNLKAGQMGETGDHQGKYDNEFTKIITQHQKGYCKDDMLDNDADRYIGSQHLAQQDANDPDVLKAFYAEIQARLPH